LAAELPWIVAPIPLGPPPLIDTTPPESSMPPPSLVALFCERVLFAMIRVPF
jgi:hypothetical protein